MSTCWSLSASARNARRSCLSYQGNMRDCSRKLLSLILATGTAAFALFVLLASCSAYTQTDQSLGVTVTILPQAGFVENVGEEKVKINVMVPPGASPHTYEPVPSQMQNLSESSMYAIVGSGIEFELTWMDKLITVNENMLVVDCSKGIEIYEGEEGDNLHAPIDPHVWMSPPNAQIMVQNIADGLIRIDPGSRSFYEDNRDAYIQRLTALDEEITSVVSGLKNRTFMVDHPAFGYFAREYGLNMLSIETEGKTPTPSELASLIEKARENKVKIIIASPQFNPTSATVIADSINATVVMIDPLAKNYIGNMNILLKELKKATE